MNPNDPRYPGGFGNGGFGGSGGNGGAGGFGNGGQQGGGSMPPPSAPPPPPPGPVLPQHIQPLALPVAPANPPLGAILWVVGCKVMKWVSVSIFVLLVAYGIICFFLFATDAISGFFGATSEMLSKFYRSISRSRFGIGAPGDGILALALILIALIGVVKLLKK